MLNLRLHRMVEALQDYIDQCFQDLVLKKAQSASSPAKSETPSSKRYHPADSPGTTSPAGKDIADILESINKRLSSFDARLSLVEILHREFKSLRESLEFSQQQVETLAAENATLRESVKCLTENVTQLNRENKKIKETVIDLQARGMRDNFVFSGIPEAVGEDADTTVKSFIKTHLKLPEDTVKNIVFDRVHRIGPMRAATGRPRPIVAKFGHFKQKEQVKSRGRELKGTDFSVNDQFPKEILERRRVLFPIRRGFIQKGSRAVITVDRLYVDGQLYRDLGITPWLY
ncbi:polymeric immunoglobulin receptor [Sarotherodon galilaeus]